jgi:hypothetical protein
MTRAATATAMPPLGAICRPPVSVAFVTTSSPVQGQYVYLRGFAESIQAGDVTAGQIAARTSLYLAAAEGSYAYGKAASYDALDLPGMPGDGGTPCLVRCLCSWQIEESDDEYRATWQLDGGEHCPGCEERAARWAPFVQPKDAGVAA